METTNRKNKYFGAIKHCAFGGCNGDSRIGRPGNRPGLKFVAFPKPCLQFRNMLPTERAANFVNSHVITCLQCKRCQEWMKCCGRQDSKWSSLFNITKDTYICEDHFINIDEKILPYPLPISEINEIKTKQKRKESPLRCPLPTKIMKMSNINEENLVVTSDANDVTAESLRTMSNINEENLVVTSDVNDVTAKSMRIVLPHLDRELPKPTVRSLSTQTTFAFKDVEILSTKIKELKEELKNLKAKHESEKMKKVNPMKVFTEKVKSNETMCKFYTGFAYAQIIMLLNFVTGLNLNYWGAKRNSDNASSSKKKFNNMEELILTLVRLRTGLLVRDLGYRFEFSTGLYTKIFTTWVQLMYNKFNSLRPLMFPSRQKIQETLPTVFSRMKNIRVIIDCTEIFCQTPSNLEHQANLFSNYKSHTTFKVLIGCTPNGAVSFVSDLFEGSISDRQIVAKSKLLDLLTEGDLVLADRGFTIKDMTDEINVQLNIPAFLKGKDKLTAAEEIQTKIIAKERIYVEHVIGRLKNFRLLQKIIPLSMRGILSQVVFVCASLLNFQPPIIE